ncbi:centromere protein V isoform X2 [Crotalus tigris]|uniref:centromere protein V isoform X2 n=1 Tax=Crotalus tigris TaxID=88082 RepID=UPI00192F9332|nr:centromere protein V isoform X2 [Crotalus tigris]
MGKARRSPGRRRTPPAPPPARERAAKSAGRAPAKPQPAKTTGAGPGGAAGAAEEEPPSLALGAQRERWLQFQKRQRVSCEEAAKLLLDTFCSICVKKQNRHFIVPASHFKLLKGADHLTTYTFNTHCAQHTFCKTCGVQSFYTPRSNPDGYGIAPHCLDEGTITKITVEPINGKEWEKAVKGHPAIRNMSKP